jgi:hypothetical protein
MACKLETVEHNMLKCLLVMSFEFHMYCSAEIAVLGLASMTPHEPFAAVDNWIIQLSFKLKTNYV